MISKQESISTAVQLSIQNFKYPPKNTKYQTRSKDFISYGLGIKSKPDINRHRAMIDFMHNLALLDCERSVLAIVLFGLAITHGEAKFNELVPEIRITSTLNFSNIPKSAQNSIRLITVSHVDELEIGDWIYVKNHPNYLDHYPDGLASGEHVICTSIKPLLFYGLLDQQERSIEEWITILHLSEPKLNKKEIQGILCDEDRNILVRRPNF